MSETILKLCISRKERYFAQMQRMYDVAVKFSEDKSFRDDFMVRYLDIKSLKSSFEESFDAVVEAQLKINPACQISNSELESFETLFYAVKSIASLHLTSEDYVGRSSELSERQQPVTSRPRLPKIELISFDGSNIEDFKTFHDTFVSLVHSNKNISTVDKFHYLLASLKGHALSVAKSIPISEDNYQIVWDNLLKKYQDRRTLICKYLDSMLNVAPFSKESVTNLNQFIEVFEHSFRALQALKIPDLADTILCHLALRILDPNTRKLFEMKNSQSEVPKFCELIEFVQNHIKVLQHSTYFSPPSSNVVGANLKGSFSPNTVKKNITQTKTSLNTVAKKSGKSQFHCCFCDSPGHMIYKCHKYRELAPSDRLQRAQNLKLCTICLKSDHKAADCTSKMFCPVCKSKTHHYLLHSSNNTTSGIPASVVAPQADESENRTVCYSSNSGSRYAVILGTAIIHVRNAAGEFMKFRAVIDSGAQTSFLTQRSAQLLGLSRQKCPFKISGLADQEVRNHGMICCNIKSDDLSSPLISFNAVILSRITINMPSVQIPNKVVEQYKYLKLADPNFYKSSEIDFLLASDVFPYICKGETINFNDFTPCAMKTIFGYVIVGRLQSDNNNANSSSLYSCLTSSEKSQDVALDTVLQKFWESDTVPCAEKFVNPRDELAEFIYQSQHYRLNTGRYVVPLLFDESKTKCLGNTQQIAQKRLLTLERKFSRNADLYESYRSFMREYEALGHMQVSNDTEPVHYFISHHAVFKPSSSTTPVRVVFDASAKCEGYSSLNEILLPGGKLQKDILEILIKFRLFQFCLSCDISKMYRQILIEPKHRSFQHILWRENPSTEMINFELTTNTYGIVCSSFLAIRTLLQLARDEGTYLPKAADVIQRAFYVDDLLVSVDSFSEACELQDQLIEIMRRGGFVLHKWMSNSSELLTRIPLDFVEKPLSIDDKTSGVKVLGIQWAPSEDCFIFKTNLQDSVNTKRSVLRLLASIYDPLGFLSPIVFIAKCIMQDLWKLGLGWDAKLPSYVKSKWENFQVELSLLNDIRINRHVLLPSVSECILFGFCDASERGIGAVVYFLSYDKYNKSKVSLVVSKSKIAPTKTVALPKLELMAAVLLCRLVKYVCEVSRDIKISQKILFSDSTVALSWIQIPPFKLQTFVANRVVQIHDLVVDAEWLHVRSENNIADICSRGVMPSDFINISQWFEGPSWLQESRDYWPVSKVEVTSENNLPEIKDKFLTCSYPVSSQKSDKGFYDFAERYSSFESLQRITAWCLRFIKSCRQNVSARKFGALTVLELNHSREVILKCVQQYHFSDAIRALSKGEQISQVSLKKLSPFLDSRGFFRVGGRLSKSLLSQESKHPILLPSKDYISRLIIEHFHIKYLHVGPRTLQGILSQSYWIISARREIRSVLSKCLKCFKCNPKNVQPSMAELPAERLTPYKLFKHVGCDIGGPFQIKESLRRNAKISKAYLCIFVCFSTKAVHLEVLSSLSTDCFLASLDRFTARRGLCEILTTDNGSNYVGTRRHLSEVQNFLLENEKDDNFNNSLSQRQIQWKFNPPTGSHFGGLFEAGIKSAKTHLKRVIGDRALTFEELSTLFCRIEGILNSRPLCPLSSDANEFEVLTAGHFLTGHNLLSVPEYNFTDVQPNRLSRWQLIQSSAQHFWKRWQRDYLHTLQQRSKWLSSARNIKINDLVLVHSDQCHSYNWSLGRIESVHPGTDGVVRVVTVRTKNGLFKRPVNKLSPLPYSC